MRILIAPDKFKGTLSAKDAAEAIAAGVRRAAAEMGTPVELEVCPVADGGEGTMDALAPALGGSSEMLSVPGPLPGSRVSAPILRFQTGGRAEALVESARAVSMSLVPGCQRDPEVTTTLGVGELLRHALGTGAARVIVAVGGSSTVDGGAGLAAALGARFFDRSGAPFVPTGGTVARIARLEPGAEPLAPIIALCDVSNPLLGPNGAARVYGPQKGATPQQVERLEAGLTNLVRVCRERGIPCHPDQPGAGSAGGIGFGLATFLGASLVPGAPFIFDLLKFDERVARADLVVTGEGRLDSQTASGKAGAEVVRRAQKAGKPCFAAVGSTEGSTDAIRAALARAGLRYEGVASATEAAGSGEAAMLEPRRWVEEAAWRLLRPRFGDGPRAE